jgi:hypothetical protein
MVHALLHEGKCDGVELRWIGGCVHHISSPGSGRMM